MHTCNGYCLARATATKIIIMKKLSLLFSTIAVCLLLILVSCTKENVNTPNAYVKETVPGFVDTPYRPTVNPADTPYLKTYPVPASFVDTPYLKK